MRDLELQITDIRYCDILLKKSSKNPEEAELEDTLNQVHSL